jgi:hypothetical protein
MTLVKISKGAFIALFLFLNINNSFASVLPDTVPPENSNERFGFCSGLGPIQVITTDECIAFAEDFLPEATDTHTEGTIFTEGSGDLILIKYRYETLPDNVEVENTLASWTYTHDEESKTCPNEDYPNYIYSIDSDDDGEIDQCSKDNPNFEKCPTGYHKYKIAVAGTNDSECFPITCSSSGTQSNQWVSGSVYNNNSGTYCDGQCAYSIEGGQNSTGTKGSFGATVVSTGSVCGQDPNNDKWQADGTNEDCTTSTLDTGSSFVTCPLGETEDAPEIPAVDNETEKVTDEEIPTLLPVEEICVDDVACEIRNLKETMTVEGLKQEEIDKILHNKQIESEQKSFNSLVKSLEELQEQNTFGLQQIATQLQDSNTTGTSSGSGSGTNVDIGTDGAGLSDEEVGDAVGGLDDVIPEETIDIQNYTAQYSGWLSADACPQSKDITLTIGGQTTTFDLTWAPMCDLFALMGILLQAAAWITVGFMIQRSI